MHISESAANQIEETVKIDLKDFMNGFILNVPFMH